MVDSLTKKLWLHPSNEPQWDPEVIWEGRGPNPEVDFLAGNFWREFFSADFFGEKIFFAENFLVEIFGVQINDFEIFWEISSKTPF